MKRIIALFLVPVIAVVAVIFLLPVFLSADVVRNKVVEQLSEWTGKKIVLTGPAKLSVFPNLSIELQGLSIASSKDADARPLVTMDGLTAQIHLLPLLTGNIEVDRFILIRPRMDLTVDASGQRSWDFERDEKTAVESTSPTGVSEYSSPIQSFKIGLMEIQEGQIKYQDLSTGAEFEATAINTKINWPDMTSPLIATGSLVWDGEVVEFGGEIADALGFISGNSSQAKLTISASPVEMSLSGLANAAADLAMDGDLELKAPSLRSLARWVGVEIPPGPGLGALTLATHFTAGGNKISLSETKLTLDGNSAEGVITLKTMEERSYIQATLALATLDLNPYLSQTTAESSAGDPEVRAASAQSWSREAFDLSALNFADADLRLSAGRILAADLDLGSGAMSASLQQGRMATELVEIEAYGGHVNGTLVINARGQVPSMTAKLNVSEANLEPLLTDLASFTRLQGIGNLAIDIAASGNSQFDIVRTLSGPIDVQVTQGVIHGVDVMQMLTSYQQRKLDAIFLGAGGETPFDFLEATFLLANGVASNDNLTLQSPTIQVSGVGTTDIVNRTLDYRMRAALTGPSEKDSNTQVKFFEIPLIVRGPWSKLRVVPDMASIIQDSTQVQETINEVGEALQQGDLNAARDAAENALRDSESSVRSLLDGILGKPQPSQ